MNPRVWVFSIMRNEIPMVKHFLLHYSDFAEKIIVYDEQSNDGTREALLANPKVEVREWPYKGLDDEAFLRAVNTEYKCARGHADWVMWPDCDELLYHPHILDVLAETKEDAIASTGYALIPDAWAHLKPGNGPIYELFPTGVRQPNYDKIIVWRPEKEMVHTIGRHTYPGQFPKINGKLGTVPKLKLLHLHHILGESWTVDRNRRNYDRAVDKRFAWNYTPEHNKPTQVGTEAWVKDAIANKRLIDVMAIPDYQVGGKPAAPLLKVQFGSGGNKLPGWDNRDMETDIRQPLPFADGSVSHVFAEHVIEHVSHKEAWNFLAECHRILAPGGIVRIAIPDVTKLFRDMIPDYLNAVEPGTTKAGAIKAAVFNHGHQAAWNLPLLGTFLAANGFKPRACEYGQSEDPVLRGVEGHWRVVGDKVARCETSIAEGVKL